ncbi:MULTISPECIES: CitMHS family transporter [unclassified Clostridium]|uniref:CitMHS family transporter n=1 Tax=unclassified Clostridium TaxID=2614128 RepID=UPI0025B8C739|nr:MULTISPECIES: citrate:proton symporter [unclassified Clostridium]
MLAFLGLLTIILLLVLVMTKKASPTVALIVVPVVTAAIGGFGLEIGEFMTSGIKSISTTGVMFIFAILFFGVLSDAGTFDPIIRRIIKVVGKNPVKIAIGTAVLAMLVHLDGSGAVTFLITIPAMLPLYDELGMRRTTLATIVALGAGTMNILPWGGPTIRAASSLGVTPTELFNPMLVPFLAGIIFVLIVAFLLGKKEAKHIGNIENTKIIEVDEKVNEEKAKLARPKLFLFNILLIVIAITIMITNKLQPHVVFMLGLCITLVINYPSVKEQKERIDAHAKEALMMASVLFAAGCFTGIMKDSGMITAMAEVVVDMIPPSLGRLIPVITGVISMPASLLFDPDSFYFGVLPVLTSSANQFGVQGIMVGRAAILGQMTTGFPISPLTASTFLLTGLAGVDIGEHQKKTIPFAFACTIVMLIVAIVLRIISL